MKDNTDGTVSVGSEQVTLKVLFGAMYGCDFHLSKDNYFILTNTGVGEGGKLGENDKYNCATSVDFYYKTLYIPFNEQSHNFLLKFQGSSPDEYEIDICDENNGIRSYHVKYNSLFFYDGIRIAIKRECDVWSDNVIAYYQNQNQTLKKRSVTGYILFFSMFIIASVLGFYNLSESKNPKDMLNTFLSGLALSSSVKIIESKVNHRIYILTQDISDMNYIQGNIGNKKEYIIPIYLPELKKKIVDDLYTAGNPIIQIDFSKPQQPVLYLSQKVGNNEINNIKHFVLEKAPFVKIVNFLICDKKVLLTQAQQGLQRLNVLFRLISTPDGYALIAQGALDEHQLFALNNFINEFYEQWGDKIINFSVTLDENILQNKSYVEPFNSGGYIFLSPRHWFFPLN